MKSPQRSKAPALHALKRSFASARSPELKERLAIAIASLDGRRA